MPTLRPASVRTALRGLVEHGRRVRRSRPIAELPGLLLGNLGLAGADLERDELARSLGW